MLVPFMMGSSTSVQAYMCNQCWCNNAVNSCSSNRGCPSSYPTVDDDDNDGDGFGNNGASSGRSQSTCCRQYSTSDGKCYRTQKEKDNPQYRNASSYTDVSNCDGNCCLNDVCGTKSECEAALKALVVAMIILGVCCCCCLGGLAQMFFMGVACFSGRRRQSGGNQNYQAYGNKQQQQQQPMQSYPQQQQYGGPPQQQPYGGPPQQGYNAGPAVQGGPPPGYPPGGGNPRETLPNFTPALHRVGSRVSNKCSRAKPALDLRKKKRGSAVWFAFSRKILARALRRRGWGNSGVALVQLGDERVRAYDGHPLAPGWRE
eukprot:gene22426-biopygen7204